MTVAAVLLVYAAGADTAGARLLGRARWAARAPLLAIITYLAAAWSVVAALGLAGLTLAVHATALGGGLSQLIGACVLRLRDAYATPGGATAAGLGSPWPQRWRRCRTMSAWWRRRPSPTAPPYSSATPTRSLSSPWPK